MAVTHAAASGADATISLIHDRIWLELQRAVQERAHAWRVPVLATTGLDGAPQARTVVLRRVDPAAGHLEIYTDARSPKLAELEREPRAALVFWSQLLHWQLRALVRMQVIRHGPRIDEAWRWISESAAARDYLAPAAPGTPADMILAEQKPGHHLCILSAEVLELDWLELGRAARHHRIRFSPDGAQRVVP